MSSGNGKVAIPPHFVGDFEMTRSREGKYPSPSRASFSILAEVRPSKMGCAQDSVFPSITLKHPLRPTATALTLST